MTQGLGDPPLPVWRPSEAAPPPSPRSSAPFRDVFSAALCGVPTTVVGLAEAPRPLRTDDWTRTADAVDHAMVAACTGPTVDLGCGPGRLTEALTAQGRTALGVDVVAESVQRTRARGCSAVRRDLFASLPGEGRWDAALLADGNVGIGGAPVRLLARAARLVRPDGRVVVEVAPPGVVSRSGWARLTGGGLTSSAFRWAVVGVDDARAAAEAAGLQLLEQVHHAGDRWSVVLARH